MTETTNPTDADTNPDTATDTNPDTATDTATDAAIDTDVAESPATDSSSADPRVAPGRSTTPPDLETEGEIAADYLEGLLDIADLDGDIDMDVEGDRAMVSLVGGDLSQLVGPQGKVLDALQDLTRLAVLRDTGHRSRLMLDVDGFRAARRSALAEEGRLAAESVKASGEPMRLAAMTPFERKVVHDAVAAAGLRSESEGEEPQRRVVVLPA